ncbi:MAG: hypothetical protein AMS27_05110 [Bacteroides sp. SM23_62_1]|nr:MAG: hypothetical protein AMS27_05110 [Bacteroides sp. SM23_62_1]
MKKLIALLSATVMVISLFSQEYLPTREDLEKFFHTKTLVVLDRNPLNTYDGEIQDAMENEWTITEYEFIKFEEFEEMRKNPEYSFLMMVNVTFEKDKLNAVYKFLNLSLGGNYYDMNRMPDLVSVPVAYRNVEEDSYNYKLGILVRFIQNHIKLIYEHPELVSSNIFKHYNDNKGDIKQKNLYLVSDELDKSVNSPARISKIYPHKFTMVTREDIKDAITNRDEQVVFLHKVGPEGTRLDARCYKILIGAGDANFYYFDWHMIDNKKPDSFLVSDFKKIAK